LVGNCICNVLTLHFKLQRPGCTIEDVLRPGSEIVAAGYTISPANIILSTGNGVNGYTLNPSLGGFVLTHLDIKIPLRGKFYSFNEGNSLYFHPPTINHLNSIKSLSRKPYSAQYVGSMIADVHQMIECCSMVESWVSGRQEEQEWEAQVTLRDIPYGPF